MAQFTLFEFENSMHVAWSIFSPDHGCQSHISVDVEKPVDIDRLIAHVVFQGPWSEVEELKRLVTAYKQSQASRPVPGDQVAESQLSG